MDNDFNEIRRIREKEIHDRDYADVEEYMQTARPWIGMMEAELKTIAKMRKFRPLLKQTMEKYGEPSDADPPKVREAVSRMIRLCRGGLHTLDETPVTLRRLIDRVSTTQPYRFGGMSVATRLGIDWRDIAPCLDHAKGLETLPEQVKEIEREISEAAARALEHYRQGGRLPLPPKRDVAEQKQDEPSNENISWDSRL